MLRSLNMVHFHFKWSLEAHDHANWDLNFPTTFRFSWSPCHDRCWSSIVFFWDAIQVSIMRMLHFLIPIRYHWEFNNILVFNTTSSLYTMQEPSHLGIFTLTISTWFSTQSTQLRTWINKDSLPLTYPPNISILTGITKFNTHGYYILW